MDNLAPQNYWELEEVNIDLLLIKQLSNVQFLAEERFLLLLVIWNIRVAASSLENPLIED